MGKWYNLLETWAAISDNDRTSLTNKTSSQSPVVKLAESTTNGKVGMKR